MQPREQKGACSAADGLRQMGQDFGSAALRIGPMDGERGLASQGHCAAHVARKLIEPRRMLLKHADDGGMSSQGRRAAPLERDTTQECASLERGTIRRELK